MEQLNAVKADKQNAPAISSDIYGLMSQQSVLNTLTLAQRVKLCSTTQSIQEFTHQGGEDVNSMFRQSPFSDAELLKEWSRHHNLTRSQLCWLSQNHWIPDSVAPHSEHSAHLADDEPQTQITVQNTTQNTLGQLNELKSKLPQLEELIFVRHELFTAADELLLQLLEIQNAQEQKSDFVAAYEAQTVVLVFVHRLLENLRHICAPVLEFLRQKKQIEPQDSPAFRRQVFNLFPVLSIEINTAIANWKAYVSEFARHLQHDKAQLEKRFFAGQSLGVFNAIESAVGDTHNGGRYSFVCTFSCGQKLAYKPRNLEIEQQFYALLTTLVQHNSEFDFFCPLFLVRENYGWMSFVPRLGCDNKQEIDDYFRRCGQLLSVLYLLGAEDIHHENVIAYKAFPVVVDLETLFHPRDDNVLSQRIQYAEHSVLKSHFIPQYELGAPGIEQAAIIGPDDLSTWPERQSLPQLVHKTVCAAEYHHSIVHGFETGYAMLMKLKPHVERWLLGCRDLPVRYIARSTQVYTRLMHGSRQPYFQQTAIRRGLFCDKLWLDTKKRPFLTELIEHEKGALEQGDVPRFEYRLGHCDLYLNANAVASGYFQRDSLSDALNRLSHLSEEDCQAQVKILRRSLLLGQNHKPSLVQQQLVGEFAPEYWFAHSQRIAELVIQQASVSQQQSFWPVYKTSDKNFQCLDSSNYTLGEGVSGILLYLAYAHSAEPSQMDLDFLTSNVNQLLVSLSSRGFASEACGGFDGLGGVLYAVSHWYHLWGENSLLEHGNALLDALSSNISGDHTFDIISGSAGAILSLVSYYHATGEQKALHIARQFAGRLIHHHCATDELSGWPNSHFKDAVLTGFGHGGSGIAYAFTQLCRVDKKPRYRQCVEQTLQFERKTYCPSKGNWRDLRFAGLEQQTSNAMTAWCNGSMGMGYSRLLMQAQGSLRLDLNSDIRLAAHNVTTNTPMTDQGLCHGNFGNLEFLHQLLFNAPELLPQGFSQSQFNLWVSGALRSLNSQGLQQNRERFEGLGLLNGLSGIGYQLLRFTSPERFPSILMLQPPGK